MNQALQEEIEQYFSIRLENIVKSNEVMAIKSNNILFLNRQTSQPQYKQWTLPIPTIYSDSLADIIKGDNLVNLSSFIDFPQPNSELKKYVNQLKFQELTSYVLGLTSGYICYSEPLFLIYDHHDAQFHFGAKSIPFNKNIGIDLRSNGFAQRLTPDWTSFKVPISDSVYIDLDILKPSHENMKLDTFSGLHYAFSTKDLLNKNHGLYRLSNALK